jgi:hypothetical protein
VFMVWFRTRVFSGLASRLGQGETWSRSIVMAGKYEPLSPRRFNDVKYIAPIREGRLAMLRWAETGYLQSRRVTTLI